MACSRQLPFCIQAGSPRYGLPSPHPCAVKRVLLSRVARCRASTGPDQVARGPTGSWCYSMYAGVSSGRQQWPERARRQSLDRPRATRHVLSERSVDRPRQRPSYGSSSPRSRRPIYPRRSSTFSHPVNHHLQIIISMKAVQN